MFLLKKLLTPFLLPPGFFSALAFCLAALSLGRGREQTRRLGLFGKGTGQAQPFWPKSPGSGFSFVLHGVSYAAKRAGQAALWAGLALLIWISSTKPAGDLVLRRLEYAYLPPAELKADAIVLLSGGIQEGAPEPFGMLELTGVTLERTIAAARIFRKYQLPVIVTGGELFAGRSEAGAMKEYLVSLGVPREKIIAEERARDTWENALFSKKICDEKGYKKVAIVTSAYHMRRAVLSFEKAGFRDAVPYPAAYKTSRAPKYYYPDYLPGYGENLRAALHEYLGLIFYRLSN